MFALFEFAITIIIVLIITYALTIIIFIINPNEFRYKQSAGVRDVHVDDDRSSCCRYSRS